MTLNPIDKAEMVIVAFESGEISYEDAEREIQTVLAGDTALYAMELELFSARCLSGMCDHPHCASGTA